MRTKSLVRPYQFDFMFLRSLPEKLDTVGRGKKRKKKYENDQSPQSFRSCLYEHGNFILGVNFRQQRGKRTFPSTLYYMPGLQNTSELH